MDVSTTGELAESGSRTRIDVLTGVRGIAAYTVLLAHAIDISFTYLPAAYVHVARSEVTPFTSRLAYLGMSLFFVLSGFVIYYNYSETFRVERFASAVYTFLVSRFARLYPLYVLSIIISLRYIPSPEFAGQPATALGYFTLTQSWTNHETAIFEPDWSISTEWFFYFAFIPLSFILIPIRRPIRALVVLLIAAAIGVAALSANMGAVTAALTPILAHGQNVSAPVWLWITYYDPYLRVFEFLTGVFAAKIYLLHRHGGAQPASTFVWVAVACGLWCAGVLFTPLGQSQMLASFLPNIIYAPALAALILFGCLYETPFGRFLAARRLVFMGDISFSVYIWSWFVMTLLSPHFVSTTFSAIAVLNSFVKVIAIVGVTTIVAYGSYLLVESPPRRWLRTLLLPPVPPPA